MHFPGNSFAPGLADRSIESAGINIQYYSHMYVPARSGTSFVCCAVLNLSTTTQGMAAICRCGRSGIRFNEWTFGDYHRERSAPANVGGRG